MQSLLYENDNKYCSLLTTAEETAQKRHYVYIYICMYVLRLPNPKSIEGLGIVVQLIDASIIFGQPDEEARSDDH